MVSPIAHPQSHAGVNMYFPNVSPMITARPPIINSVVYNSAFGFQDKVSIIQIAITAHMSPRRNPVAILNASLLWLPFAT